MTPAKNIESKKSSKPSAAKKPSGGKVRVMDAKARTGKRSRSCGA